jgi:hypothetical protein
MSTYADNLAVSTYADTIDMSTNGDTAPNNGHAGVSSVERKLGLKGAAARGLSKRKVSALPAAPARQSPVSPSDSRSRRSVSVSALR